jgi:hypothetical protein
VANESELSMVTQDRKFSVWIAHGRTNFQCEPSKKKIQCEIFQCGSNIDLSGQKLYLSVLFFIGNAKTEKRRHINGQCIHANSNLVVY